MARRMREMGLRVALGADRTQIMRLVFTDGLRPVAEGLVIGLLVAVEVRVLLQSQLSTPLSPIDPVVCLLAIAPLIVAALAACYLPARRASSVDPNVALRDL
jgi:ABC-type antimicrobial peptide transport system permease subunit